MWKRLAVILMVGLLLGGCGRKTPSAPAGPTPLRVCLAGLGEDQAFMEQQIRQYQTFFPGAGIELIPLGAADLRSPSKETLNLMERCDILIFPSSLQNAVTKHARLAPLPLKEGVQEARADLPPELLRLVDNGLTPRAMPLGWSPLMLFYSRPHFDRAGISYPSDYWGWGDLVEAFQMITADIDRNGQTDVFGIEFQAAPEEAAAVMLMFDGQVTDPATGRLVLGRPDNLKTNAEALDFYRDLVASYRVASSPALDQGRGLFERGKAGVCFGGIRLARSLQSRNIGNWSMAPLPRGKVRGTVVSVLLAAVTARCDRKEAAAGLIAFLARTEAQRLLVTDRTGWLPVRSSVLEDLLRSDELKRSGIPEPVFAVRELSNARMTDAPLSSPDVRLLLEEKLLLLFKGGIKSQDLLEQVQKADDGR